MRSPGEMAGNMGKGPMLEVTMQHAAAMMSGKWIEVVVSVFVKAAGLGGRFECCGASVLELFEGESFRKGRDKVGIKKVGVGRKCAGLIQDFSFVMIMVVAHGVTSVVHGKVDGIPVGCDETLGLGKSH